MMIKSSHKHMNEIVQFKKQTFNLLQVTERYDDLKTLGAPTH